jgi:hypothetical protein
MFDHGQAGWLESDALRYKPWCRPRIIKGILAPTIAVTIEIFHVTTSNSIIRPRPCIFENSRRRLHATENVATHCGTFDYDGNTKWKLARVGLNVRSREADIDENEQESD